jgi:hypothetical protein
MSLVCLRRNNVPYGKSKGASALRSKLCEPPPVGFPCRQVAVRLVKESRSVARLWRRLIALLL